MDFQTTQNKLSAVIKFNAEKLTAVNATELKNELLELNKKGVNNIILDLTSTISSGNAYTLAPVLRATAKA